jgi:hypothetical protein
MDRVVVVVFLFPWGQCGGWRVGALAFEPEVLRGWRLMGDV